MQYLKNLDLQLFHFFNTAGHGSGLEKLITLADKYGIYFFAAVVAAYFFINRTTFWRAGIAAVLARGVIVEPIRFFYQRPRPFLVLEDARQLIEKNSTEGSFPSGHAAFYFAIAFAVYFSHKAAGRILLVVALLLGISRVYLGVHYPSDILGGIAVGAFSAWVAKLIFRKNQNA